MTKKSTILIVVLLVVALAFILLKTRSDIRLYGSSANRWRSINVEGKIAELGKRTLSGKDDVTVKLGALTDFSWDRVCLVGPYTSDKEINELMGFRWGCATAWDMEVCLCGDYISLLFIDQGNVIPVRIDTRKLSVVNEGDNRCFRSDEGVQVLYCFETLTWQDTSQERVTMHFRTEKDMVSVSGE